MMPVAWCDVDGGAVEVEYKLHAVSSIQNSRFVFVYVLLETIDYLH